MKCMDIHCGREATRAIKLVIPDANSDETAAEGLIGIELCDLHAGDAECWDFGDLGAALTMLARAFGRPGTEPDVSESYAESVPVGCAEHEAFRSTSEGHPS